MRRKHLLATSALLGLTTACLIENLGEQIGNVADQLNQSQKPVAFSLDAEDLGMALEESGELGAASATATSPTSNLRRIDTAGELQAAVTQGTLIVQDVVVAPDRKVYVVANNSFISGGQYTDENGQVIENKLPCVIWQLDNTSNRATCIENSQISVFEFGKGGGGSTLKPEAVQFDADGGVYYYFSTNGMDGGKAGLRRYKDGVTTDLLNDNVSIFTFLVVADGTVYISGSTDTNNAKWFRRILPDGSVDPIDDDGVGFLAEFPDGNLYVTVNGQGGVSRFLPSEGALDVTDWIQGYINSGDNPYRFGCELFMEPGAGAPPNECGSIVTKFITTSDDNVYAIAQVGGGKSNMVRYYPEVNTLTTSVANVNIAEAKGNELLIAGTTDSSDNALILFDPATTSETNLLGDEQIEIYRMGLLPGGTQLMFDGLRFSDNSYVLCRTPLDGSAAPNCRKTGENKLLDLKILGD